MKPKAIYLGVRKSKSQRSNMKENGFVFIFYLDEKKHIC